MEAIIFELIMQVFACIKDRRDQNAMVAEVKEDLGRPRMRHYRGIVRTLRDQEDLHGLPLFREAREIYSMLQEADAEDIDDMVDEAVSIATQLGRAL